MGSLLDDPDHSDVVFVIRRKRRHPKTGAIVTRERRIYAIKKILASRCEYFRDMFESGFLEADATTGSDEEGDDDHALTSASSRGVGQDQLGLLGSALSSAGEEDDDDLGLEDSDEEMDIDEVYELGRSDDPRHSHDEASTSNAAPASKASASASVHLIKRCHDVNAKRARMFRNPAFPLVDPCLSLLLQLHQHPHLPIATKHAPSVAR